MDDALRGVASARQRRQRRSRPGGTGRSEQQPAAAVRSAHQVRQARNCDAFEARIAAGELRASQAGRGFSAVPKPKLCFADLALHAPAALVRLGIEASSALNRGLTCAADPWRAADCNARGCATGAPRRKRCRTTALGTHCNGIVALIRGVQALTCTAIAPLLQSAVRAPRATRSGAARLLHACWLVPYWHVSWSSWHGNLQPPTPLTKR